MDVSEHARLSGLVLGSNQEESASWTRNDQDWLPRKLCDHASVVAHPPYNNKEESIVVVGGLDQQDKATNSVLLLNAAEGSNCRHWIEGPAMNEARSSLAAVVCNGSVYAIGGKHDRFSVLNTIERIDIIHLLSPKKCDKENPWFTLTSQLSKAREYFSAAAIHNRYIVVAGGWSIDVGALASVEIIDTVQESQPHVFPGPPLNVPRVFFGMTVIGSCMYVVGGLSHDLLEAEAFKSVEYLKLSDSRGEGTNNNATSMFPSSLSWAIHEDLALNEPRCGHAVARVGSCLVVSGGSPSTSHPSAQSVEIMDTKRNKVWKLIPEMTVPRIWHTMVSISTGIFCISGSGVNAYEQLSLMDQNSVVFRKLLMGSKRPCLKEM